MITFIQRRLWVVIPTVLQDKHLGHARDALAEEAGSLQD